MGFAPRSGATRQEHALRVRHCVRPGASLVRICFSESARKRTAVFSSWAATPAGFPPSVPSADSHAEAQRPQPRRRRPRGALDAAAGPAPPPPRAAHSGGPSCVTQETQQRLGALGEQMRETHFVLTPELGHGGLHTGSGRRQSPKPRGGPPRQPRQPRQPRRAWKRGCAPARAQTHAALPEAPDLRGEHGGLKLPAHCVTGTRPAPDRTPNHHAVCTQGLLPG